MALPFFKTAEIAPPADIEAASLRSDRFRLEREVDWQRLEGIVTALEKDVRAVSAMMICSTCRCSIAKPLPVLPWRAKLRSMRLR